MSDLDPDKLDKLKVTELQEELKSRGLDTKGKKGVLIARLKKALIDDGDREVDISMNTSENQDESSQDVSKDLLDRSEADYESQDITEDKEPIPDQETVPETIIAPESIKEEKQETVMESFNELATQPLIPEQNSSPVSTQELENLEANLKEITPVSPEKQTFIKSEPVSQEFELSKEMPDVTDTNQATEREGGNEEEPMENADSEVKEEETESEKQINGEAVAEQNEVKSQDHKPQRGDKRKRSLSRDKDKLSDRNRSRESDSRSAGRERERVKKEIPPWPSKQPHSPIEPEDHEWKQFTHVSLDKYNSDLFLKISKDGLTAKPWTEDGFAMVWAGARGTFGVKTGKVAFEVKCVENLDVSHLGADEVNPHVLRVGWSTDNNNLLLGEEQLSFGYGGTGKASTNLNFKDYGEKFTAGDVVTAYIDMDSDPIGISFSKNGLHLGTCFEVEKEKLGSKALFPHVLTKNTSFECNFGSKEEPYFPLQESFVFIDKIPIQERVRGMEQPERNEDCEVIMMIGLPASGKTTWAEKYDQQNPNAKFNVLGTNNIIDKMKVMGLPRKNNYAGRWDILIDKSSKCLNRLLEVACKRTRNYIFDQTNVYASARRRKMMPFEGFQRRAVVVIPDDEEYKKRLELQQSVEGKQVPESAIYEMKANFTIPDVGMLFDEVEFTELQREEAEKLVEKYREEGQANLPPPEKRFRGDDTRKRDSFGSNHDRDRLNGGSRRGGGDRRGVGGRFGGGGGGSFGRDGGGCWGGGGGDRWSGSRNDRRSGSGNDRWSGGGNDRWSGGGNDRWSGGGNDRWGGGGNDRWSGGGNDRWSGGGNDRWSGGGNDRWSGGGNDRWSGGGNDRWSGGGEDRYSGGGRSDHIGGGGRQGGGGRLGGGGREERYGSGGGGSYDRDRSGGSRYDSRERGSGEGGGYGGGGSYGGSSSRGGGYSKSVHGGGGSRSGGTSKGSYSQSSGSGGWGSHQGGSTQSWGPPSQQSWPQQSGQPAWGTSGYGQVCLVKI